jgi:hypothetical protein
VEWLLRYGPAEVAATLTTVLVVQALDRATGSAALAAYAGALGDGLVFYGVLFLREWLVQQRKRARVATGRAPTSLYVAREMFLEFGAAEMLDLFVIRPFCLGAGLRLLGDALGPLAGKLTADVMFYAQVLTVRELRLHQRRRCAER